jgi:hypothetical protein
MNDVDCLKKVNTIVSKELKKEFDGDYDLIKKDIKIMMKFYIKENGKADSIVFVKSNLEEKGINEELIINSLMEQDYGCIREIYYAHKPNPDEVTIIFNPELCN